MATIYWRNGRAWARARVRGAEIRESLNTCSKQEAEERFREFVSRLGTLRKGRLCPREVSFANGVRVFSEAHLPNLKASSQTRYRQSLRKLTPHFEATTLQSLSRVKLTEYVAFERKRGVSDSTIRRDLGCLSSVFTVASDHQLCDANPVLQFLRAKKKSKQLVEADFRTRYLSHSEEFRLLRQARTEAEEAGLSLARRQEKLMILCAIALYIDTGLRAQELLQAEWSWIDADLKEITVPSHVAKNHKGRVVPLLDRALTILQQLPRHQTSPYVLWRCRQGKRFKDLNHTLQRISAKAHVHNLTIHDLRRTAGCRLLQDWGLSLVEVCKWLGHGSTQITESRYAFLKTANLHQALGRKRGNATVLANRGFFGPVVADHAAAEGLTEEVLSA